MVNSGNIDLRYNEKSLKMQMPTKGNFSRIVN